MKEDSGTAFFRQKRNLIALGVWSFLILCLLAGIVTNACLYQAELISGSAVMRRLFYSLLCFVMMSAIYLVEAIFRIRFPLFLEIVLTSFAFISLAGGTVFNLYVLVPIWDKLLHTLSGPMFAIVGMCLADILLRNQQNGARKIVTAVLIGFFFALVVGYVWEIFEYTVDSIIPGYDNQRWAAGVVEELENGYYIVTDNRGAGLHDTMWDMICNLIGATVYSVGMLILCFKKPARLKLFRTDVLKRKQKAEPQAPQKQQEQQEPQPQAPQDTAE